MRMLAIGALASAALWVVLAAGPAAAVGGWTGPTRVATGHYGDASVAIDPNGKVHAVVRGDSGLWYITNRTGPWTRTRATTYENAVTKDYDPSIALDSGNHVYIAFGRFGCPGSPSPEHCAPTTGDVWYVTNRTGSFRSPIRISDCNCGRPSMKIVSGKLLVAYADNRSTPGDGPWPLYFATNTSGQWRQRVVDPDGIGPSLRYGTDGKVRIAYTTASGVWYAVQSGNIFTTRWVTGSAAGASVPALALDGSNRTRVAWTESMWDGSTWTSIARETSTGWSTGKLTDQSDSTGPAIAGDGRDNTHILLGPNTGGAYYYTDESGRWVGTTLSSTLVSTGRVALRMDPSNRVVALFAARSGTFDGVFYARH